MRRSTISAGVDGQAQHKDQQHAAGKNADTPMNRHRAARRHHVFFFDAT